MSKSGKKCGKVKRIKNNPKVKFIPCTYTGGIKRKYRGKTIESIAEFISEEEALKAKK